MTRPCNHCGSTLESGTLFCPRCGTMAAAQPGSAVECENHPGQPAVACCVVCGKPVCGDCSTTHEGLWFCDQPDHQSVYAEFELLVHLKSGFEADMIRENLRQAGIPARVYDQHDHTGAFWLGAASTVRLFVRRDSAGAARSTLESLGLLHTLTE